MPEAATRKKPTSTENTTRLVSEKESKLRPRHLGSTGPSSCSSSGMLTIKPTKETIATMLKGLSCESL